MVIYSGLTGVWFNARAIIIGIRMLPCRIVRIAAPAFTANQHSALVSRKCRRIFTDAMPHPASSSDDVVHREPFLRSLMHRQLRLSISCAALFLLALLGIPLLNYFAPDFMATRVAGFTLTWLILGVLFFPFVWVISFVFIKRSIALERDEVKSVQR